ncbi:MAG: sensor histidine kinase, partial [Gaiellales bacterium]
AVRVVVRDDGVGTATTITPGMGLAVVDAWTGVVGGRWSLEPLPGGGTELAATLPWRADDGSPQPA